MSEQVRILEANRDVFWKVHEEYLRRDIFPNVTIGVPLAEEDRERFLSQEHRENMDRLCERDVDRVRRVFFMHKEEQIGFAFYCTYASEDGKCFIIDFCIYPSFRNKGYGRKCFEAIRKLEERATYYELNLSNESNKKFWESVGFKYNGFDAYGSILYVLPPEQEETIEIEIVEQEDMWQLLRLENGYKHEVGEAFLDAIQQDALENAIEKREIYFFVAKRKTRVIGMCSVCKTFSTFNCKDGGIFEDFYIEPVFRHKGVARLLVNQVFKWCKSQNIVSLWVGCSEADIDMYKSLGFEIPLGNLLTWSV